MGPKGDGSIGFFRGKMVKQFLLVHYLHVVQEHKTVIYYYITMPNLMI